MAPIVLKVKGNMQSLPFGNLDSSDDLSKTWRVCTKVKDSLENGSRLENLSWRLWFAHNVNKNEANNIKKSTVTPKETVTNSLRNFKVPDNFDFKAKNNEKKSIIIPKVKQESKETDYRRQLCLQQQKQAHDMITHKMKYPPTASIKKTLPEKREEFTLHQYTSDQAGDQVIELDDIFKSLGGNMQAYLNPSEEQQLDNLINEAWPISSSSTSSIHDPYNNINSNATSPMNISFPSSVTNTMYNQEQQHQQYSDYTNNNDVQDSALYVSSEAMPPIPLGTLHNKLLNTLPRETLESAERLLTTTNTTTNSIDENNDMMVEFQLQQQQHNNNNNNHIMYHQSTPNTPFISSSSSFNVSTPTMLNSQQQQQQQQLNDSSSSSTSSSSYRFFMPPPQQPVQHQHTTTPYTFSHHHPHPPQHSKSLPPSRAASPPPCDVSNSSSSASSSPISPTVISTTSTPQKRASAPINSSPSEGKAPICSNCSTASTPLWRRSANDELLCNACGLYLKLHNAPRPKYLKPQSSRKDQKGEDENIIQPLCSNCGTSTTPLWRRDLDGSSLCNACGLYLKLHHEKRPLSMKTDNIKKRQRCDNNSTKAQPITPTSNTAIKKKNRVMEEPLTTTVTFDSTYSYMEDVIPNNNQQQQQQQQEYSPFGTFGLTLTNQPI